MTDRPVVTTDPLQPSTSFVENVPSFRELIPTPVGLSASSRATTRKRRVGHACVLTASPYKKQLIENKRLKMEAQEKKVNRSKKAVEKEVNKQLKLYKKNVKQLDKRSKCERIGKGTTATSDNKQVAHKKNVQVKVKVRENKKVAQKDSDCECLYCGSLYSVSTEDFVQCQGSCGLWAHVGCADIDLRGHFVCEHCN